MSEIQEQDPCIEKCNEYPCVWKDEPDNPECWGEKCDHKKLHDYTEIHNKYAPTGYRIRSDGVQKRIEHKDKEGNIFETWENITKTPIWIEKIYQGTDNKIYLTISFIDISNKQKQLHVDQKDILTKKGLLELTSYGIITTDSFVRNLTEYFSCSIAEYKDEIGKIFTRMGWHENNNSFVLGTRIIRKSSESNTVFINTIQDEIIDAYSKKGTAKGWYNNLSELLKYPNVRFLVYAACTPPLLRILNTKSFVKEDTGDTSIGKTTCALIGMSIWGNPMELILSTDTTAYAIEENCTIRNDLPILLDDITLMQKETLNRIVYMVANEGGKNRGKKEGGLREVNRWKSVIITTGELYITGTKSTGGADVRIVSSEGGIGIFDPENVSRYENTILDNYGVIGPLVINKILNNKKTLIEEYHQNISLFESKISELRDPDGTIKRLVKTYSAIAVAGQIFESILNDLDIEPINPLFIVADKLGEKINGSTGKISERAFEAILDWYHSESRSFCYNGDGDAGTKYKLFGNFHSIQTEDQITEYLEIIPSELEKFLDRHFEKKDTLKSFTKNWIDEGKLIPYEEKKTGKRTITTFATIKAGMKQQRVYKFIVSEYKASIDIGLDIPYTKIQ